MMDFFGSKYCIKTWNNEYLGRHVSLDTETTIAPFTSTPELVTLQAFGGGEEVYYVPINRLFLFFNRHYSTCFTFHNAPFDVDVLQKAGLPAKIIYDLFDRGNVRDTGVLYRLYGLATTGISPFKFNLALACREHLGIELIKDEVRENFGQFLNTPIQEIPPEYLEYGAKDVIATFYLHQALIGKIQSLDKEGTLLSHDVQVKGDLALNHIYKKGVGFNLLHRDQWLSNMDKELERLSDILACYGWVRGTKGNQQRFERILKFIKIDDKLSRTSDGSISTKAEELLPFANNPFIHAYLQFMEIEKATSFVRDVQSSRVHPKYTLLKNTGRTSCSKPNVQQLPRVGGIREMFVPSEGNVFIITDYSAIELAVLAQINYTKFGHSQMRELINAGECLHYNTACALYKKKKEEITKEERQFAKIPNFGFGANMSYHTFIDYCKPQGIQLTESESFDIKKTWLNTYPEMRDFFNIGDEKNVYTLTGRLRANCTYTAYLNTQFQGLAADGAKLALYELDKAGFKTIMFVHDEIVTEVPESKAEEMRDLQERLMVQAMSMVVPDVKVSVESQITYNYTK